MVKVDVTDEAIMDASALEVYKAFLDEVSGLTNWWMPHLAFELKTEEPVEREGAVFDIIANPNKRMKARFSCRVKNFVKAKSMDLDIFAGAVKGSGQWRFQEIDGKTKVQIRFNVKSNKLLVSIVSPFVDLAKSHSEAIQYGYKTCNEYLSKK